MYEGHSYADGQRLVLDLGPYESLQLQSSNDLTGSRISSQYPVGVLSGHTCNWLFAKCDHVYEQLLPVSSWGSNFMVAPLSFQNKYDSIFIQASQSTKVNIQNGKMNTDETLSEGQSMEVQFHFPDAVTIKADHGVQVLMLFNGAKLHDDRLYDNFLMTILPTEVLCSSYSLVTQSGFDNFALILAPKVKRHELIIDGKTLTGIAWHDMPGTDFSFSEVALRPDPVRIFYSSGFSFGLYGVGFTMMTSFGSPALCRLPATCSNPNPSCTLPCMETCTCNKGFVLIDGQCQPVENCGCTHKGRYLAPGQSFWADDKCQERCTCNASTRKVECKAVGCKAGTLCQVLNGIKDCHPISHGKCRATGDPHYVTFDNKKFDFMGTCVYQMVKHSMGTDLEPFEVLVQNDHRGSNVVSYTKLVEVKVDGELANLPLSLAGNRVSVYKSGRYAVVSTNFGLKVFFDWERALFVSLPSSYMGQVSGLCGNYNGKAEDDLTPKDGKVIVPQTEFGASWQVEKIPGCVDSCQGKCPSCDITQKRQYETGTFCGILTDPKGPFRDCHSKVNPADYFEDCVFDVCSFEGRKNVLCQAITSYSSACQAVGAKVYSWRTRQFCEIKCPTNSRYETCAAVCPATCQVNLAALGCDEPCREGCVCEEGFVLSGERCVPVSQCGCVDGDRYYTLNQVFYPNGKCDKECKCIADGEVECKTFACGANEKCQVQNGKRQCQAFGVGICQRSGDLHYRSFDGRVFNLQGTCTYTLSKTNLMKDTRLVAFAVQVENDNQKMSVTKGVSLDIYGFNLVLRNTVSGVLVNGVLHYLPLSLNNGAVNVYQKGVHYFMATDFGLLLTYDLNYFLTLTVPGNYKDQTSGLCGNFNDNPKDDFQQPDSGLTEDLNVFTASWEVKVPGVKCERGCKGDNCMTNDKTDKCPDAMSSQACLPMIDGDAFIQCRAKVDPKVYYDNCVADSCASKGDRKVVCDSMAAYALRCHLAGINVNWRTDNLCPMKCPANSHYEACSNNCGVACPGLTDVVECPSSCTEGCTCNVGFLFNGQSCVPMTQCGCYENGRTFRPNEAVYGEGCKQSCRCDAVNGLVCTAHSCSADSPCLINEGVRACVQEGKQLKKLGSIQVVKPGICWAQGVFHYSTFDRRRFDFMGTCTYLFAKNCEKNTNLPTFEISAQNENRGDTRVSYIGLVTVKIAGYTITTVKSEIGRVRVDNNLWSLPLTLNEGKLQLFQGGRSIFIQTDFGLLVRYDWISLLVVTLPSSFAGKTCGLCGNFNGVPKDDLTTSEGTQAAGVPAFGASWKVPGLVKDDRCTDDCVGGCKTCTNQQMKTWEVDSSCGLMALVNKGPFSKCHAAVDPVPYMDNCKFDLCMNGGLKYFLCKSLESYAESCQEADVQVDDWRTIAKCPYKCQANSVYQQCGSACPSTCSNPNPPCTLPCMETCTCNKGFVLIDGQCQPVENCGCTHKGRYLAPGQSYWTDDKCQERCTCNASTRKVECKAVGCKAGTLCQVLNGIKDCHPISHGKCRATGDPHYVTFDNKKFDFMGTCVYQMVKHSMGTDLEPFEVLVQNDHRGSNVVAYTKLVEVKVYSLSVVISRTYQAVVMVDGELANLPLSLAGNRVSVYKSGRYAVVSTNFGLKVSFDWERALFVSLPSSYMGQVSGLCGNYNGKAEDDLTPKDGKVIVPQTEFGASWQVEKIPGCVDSCQGKCPSCDVTQKRQYETGTFCGILTDPKGPFRDCHSKVNPADYFEDCVFDVCSFEGRKKVLCQAITSYSSACQAVGAKVYSWRTSQFCEIKCPANSRYETCAVVCPATCQVNLAALGCDEPCREGCVCEEGFVLSGERCVPVSQCGCVDGDRYYTLNQVFYPNGKCDKECKCTADGEVECKTFTCGANEKCQVQKGKRQCQAVGVGICQRSGDLHYRSFDGRVFNLQGTCTYTLSKTNLMKDTRLVAFAVQVENDNQKMSVTKGVSLDIYGFNLVLRNTVNGVLHYLPVSLNNGAVNVYQKGVHYFMATDFGLLLTYDLNYFLTLTVPGNYKDQTSGLCGNFNDNPKDDFQQPDSGLTEDLNVFTGSWEVRVPGVKCERGCKADNCMTNYKTDKCPDAISSQACLRMIDGDAFKQCRAKVDPKVYYDNCMADSCATKGDRKVVCNSIAAYALRCHLAEINVNWRTDNLCPMKCPANSHFEACSNNCGVACPGLTDVVECPSSCTEGCTCNVGFLFNGQSCVPMTQCGCYENGRTFRPNEAVYGEGCKQSCRCDAVNGLVCTAHSCSADSQCLINEGIRACAVCVPPPTSTCWAWGDPHHHTFDGYNYVFESACRYIYSRTCGNLEGLATFSINERNGDRESDDAANVKEFVVNVYSFKITASKNSSSEVNKEPVKVPIVLGNGQVKIAYKSGSLWIVTDFGLEVWFELEWKVVILLPRTYEGKVCGLCGNFNGERNDELQDPAGQVVSTVQEWGSSWRTDEPGDDPCWLD
ncbi:unnamed protein product [Lota lota]